MILDAEVADAVDSLARRGRGETRSIVPVFAEDTATEGRAETWHRGEDVGREILGEERARPPVPEQLGDELAADRGGVLIRDEEVVAIVLEVGLDALVEVRQAEAQVRAGIAARADVLQAQAARAAAQVDLIAARNQVETSFTGLRASMGLRLTDSVSVAAPAAPPVLAQSREQALAGASDRPEVVRAHADVAAAQAGLALAEVQAGPLLAVTTSSAYDVWKDPPTTNAVVWSIGATVTYSLFDGGLARAAVAAARANLANAQAKETLALQTAQVDALTAWVSLQDAMARVDATRASEAAATEALRAAEGRYQAGAGTIVEVLTARTALQSASLSRIQAEFDVQSAVLQLRYSIGRPVVGGN